MIKVLQFTVAAAKGGRTQYVLNMWKHIDKTKIQFDFITFSPTLDFERELLVNGGRVYHMSCYPEDDREQFIKELDSILENGYDVIHVHTSFWKDTIVEECAKRKNIKKIIIHGHSSGCGRGMNKDEEEAATRLHNQVKMRITEDMATDFWACSEEAADWLYGGQINKNKIKIIPNAIDTKRFSYQPNIRNDVRQELGIENKFVLGHVGRLEYVKNHTFMLNVLAEVLQENSEVVLLLVGEGRMENAIRERAKELGIENHILMLGKSDTPERYLQSMDLFLFPSLFEGFPLAVIEAQSVGLKCLCSNVVTDKVALTDNVEYLALDDKRDWVKKIVKLSAGYQREDQSAIIQKRGYDIHRQIRAIEAEYMR